MISQNIWEYSGHTRQYTGFRTYAIYPNPVDEELSVSFSGSNDKSKFKQKFEKEDKATLYNSKGEIVRTVKIAEAVDNVKIDTKGIPEGIYFLHIKNGKKIDKQQIIIKH